MTVIYIGSLRDPPVMSKFPHRYQGPLQGFICLMMPAITIFLG
jgi:hypothetical protein